jgi:hypothetical protein
MVFLCLYSVLKERANVKARYNQAAQSGMIHKAILTKAIKWLDLNKHKADF